MKTIFYQLGDKIRALHVWTFLLLMLFSLSANAQRGDKGYKGVSNRNGMLVFTDSLAFQSVYQQLEAEIAAQDRNPNAKSGPVLVGECTDDNAVLANFEAQMGIASLRTKYLRQECEDLSRGLAPEQLTENPVPDEILSAFLNEKGEMQVGTKIYYMPTVESYFVVMDGDLRTLSALERGVNPGNFSNVEVHSNLPVQADFEYTYLSENTVQFSYSGTPLPRGSTFFWNFGDGTVSTEANPTHTFQGSADQYYVRLVVTLGSQGGVQRDGGIGALLLEIGKWIWYQVPCTPFIVKNETGNPGELCFNVVTWGNHPITSYSWSFGDGATSTDANPCHTYTCDKWYNVKVTVVFADSCGTRSFIRPVNVNSFNCCTNYASITGFKYYQGGQRRIKHSQGQYYIIGLGTFITSKMTNYKKKNNGGWKKAKANLALNRSGRVYLKSPEGCKCEEPYDISDYEAVTNKKKIKMNKKIWFKQAKIAQDDPWQVAFIVNGATIHTQVTPVTCD